MVCFNTPRECPRVPYNLCVYLRRIHDIVAHGEYGQRRLDGGGGCRCGRTLKNFLHIKTVIVTLPWSVDMCNWTIFLISIKFKTFFCFRHENHVSNVNILPPMLPALPIVWCVNEWLVIHDSALPSIWLAACGFGVSTRTGTHNVRERMSRSVEVTISRKYYSPLYTFSSERSNGAMQSVPLYELQFWLALPSRIHSMLAPPPPSSICVQQVHRFWSFSSARLFCVTVQWWRSQISEIEYMLHCYTLLTCIHHHHPIYRVVHAKICCSTTFGIHSQLVPIPTTYLHHYDYPAQAHRRGVYILFIIKN